MKLIRAENSILLLSFEEFVESVLYYMTKKEIRIEQVIVEMERQREKEKLEAEKMREEWEAFYLQYDD